MTRTLHNGDVFANTTKNSGDSTMYSYWGYGPDKNQILKVDFWPKLQHFWENLNFIFLLHNFSKYVNCPKCKKKTILEIKIAKKCSKTTKIWHFEKIIPTLHNEDVFANTTKSSGDSKMYSYWDMNRKKTQILKVVFWPKLQKFWKNLNFEFLLHNFN